MRATSVPGRDCPATSSATARPSHRRCRSSLLTQPFAAASLTALTMPADVALAGEHVHDAGVQSVATFWPYIGVQPLRDVRRLVVGLQSRAL